MEEMKALNADIFCLQEVGVSYHPMLSKALEEIGYTGDFYQKMLATQEGLATYYRKSAFECLAVKKISYNEMLSEALGLIGLDPSLSMEWERDQVFLMTKLTHLKTREIVTIGNIHTIWDYFSQPDVTLLQAALALEHLVKFAEGGAFIFAGDFNVAPHMPTYSFLAKGQLTDSETSVVKNAATVLFDGKPLFEALENLYSHPYSSLSSSYSEVRSQEPNMTSYDDNEGERPYCLDYIWYNKDKLKVNCVLDTILQPTSRIPNRIFPSDHLSIKATFSFF